MHVGKDFDLRSPGDPQPEDDSYTDPQNKWHKDSVHGTAMMSLVAGKTLGAVKNANPVVVRMPRRRAFGPFSKEDWLKGLMQINDDIGLQYSKQQTTAVVLLATYFPLEMFYRKDPRDNGEAKDKNGKPIDDSAGWVGEAYSLLTKLESKGALIVTGTGNKGYDRIDGWPARFGMKTSSLQISSLIVVGSVTPDGRKALHNYDHAGGVPHGMLHLWVPIREQQS